MLGPILNQAPILSQRFSSSVFSSSVKKAEDLVSLKKTQEDLVSETTVAIVGVGGCGCNSVCNMSKTFFDGSKPDGQDSLEKNVRFVAVNTDVQALGSLKNPKLKKVQIGVKTTKGLGAGTNPLVGQKSAEENLTDLIEQIHLNASPKNKTQKDGDSTQDNSQPDSSDPDNSKKISGKPQESENEKTPSIVFVISGLGGGTGTGAAPLIAAEAKKRGILTVAICFLPFNFEGKQRSKVANKGIQQFLGYNYVFNQMINKAKRQKKLRKSRKSNPILKSNPLFPFLTQDGEKFFQDQVSMTGSDSVDPIQTYSQMLNPYLGNSMFACCDTLFVFDNQKLYQMIAKESPEGNENIPMTEVFQKADEYITQSVRGIVDVIFRPGLINVDFADVKTIMSSGGKGVMWTKLVDVSTDTETAPLKKTVDGKIVENEDDDEVLKFLPSDPDDIMKIQNGKKMLISVWGSKETLSLKRVTAIAEEMKRLISGSPKSKLLKNLQTHGPSQQLANGSQNVKKSGTQNVLSSIFYPQSKKSENSGVMLSFQQMPGMAGQQAMGGNVQQQGMNSQQPQQQQNGMQQQVVMGQGNQQMNMQGHQNLVMNEATGTKKIKVKKNQYSSSAQDNDEDEDDEIQIMIGASVDENLKNQLKVTIVVTGVDEDIDGASPFFDFQNSFSSHYHENDDDEGMMNASARQKMLKQEKKMKQQKEGFVASIKNSVVGTYNDSVSTVRNWFKDNW